MKINWTKLLASIVICQLAGFIGSFFTTPNIPTWYAGVAKPDFNPPNWLFAPVWTTLFTLMGISLYLVWMKGQKNPPVKKAMLVFAVQLTLNTIWSLLFFGMQNPRLAFFEILALWVSIAVTIILFWRIDRRAGIMLIPYIAWVSFATLLNYYIWMLNP